MDVSSAVMQKGRRSAPKINEPQPNPTNTNEPQSGEVLTTDDVAAVFGVGAGAVRDWRHMKIGPDYFRTPSGQVRYRRSDVEASIEAGFVRH